MSQASSNSDPAKGRHRKRFVAISALVAVVIVVVAVVLLRDRAESPEAPDDAVNVPLGVEEAVIIRFAGPQLVARPYRRGASVTLRIARQVESERVRVYDVRYVVNLPGKFDLTDYLMSADGASIDSLPSFPVRGMTQLTKDMETRIYEIEDVEIEIWHWYYESLAGLSVLWVAWLFGLIFIGRAKRRPPPPPPIVAPPSVTAQIDSYLQRLMDRELTVVEKTELELLLLAHWKESLGYDGRLAEVCQRLRCDRELGGAYGALESWLHSPGSEVDAQQIVSLCRPRVAARSEGLL